MKEVIKLSKMQLIYLKHICKKGWGGYSKPCDELDEMVKNGLLTKSDGPFGDVVYRPTDYGYRYINSITISSSSTPEKCRSCDGKGIVSRTFELLK